MQHPTDDVVEELGLGKGLMSAFVSNDPQACSHEAGPKAIKRPKGELDSAVEERMRKLQCLGLDESVQVGSGVI